ncbi:MAG: hypothetical protein ACSHYA_18025 [Opitutaceae bacterium]
MYRFLSVTASTYLISTAISMGVVIRSPDTIAPDRNDRFLNFETASIEKNDEFIHDDVDLTGVGWYTADTRRQFTMVSPKHFVGANHFKPSVNSSIRFLSSDGSVKIYAIGTVQSILNDSGEATDLFIGTLEEEISPDAGIQLVPYLNLASEGAYVGRNLAFLGKVARGGQGTINAFSDFGGDPITGGSGINQTRTFQMVYNSLGGFVDDAYVEIGDSGSPSLAKEGDRAAIVGTHTAVLNAGGLITTIDTFVPHYIEELNEVMAVDGFHMTKLTPPSTALTVTPTVPTVARAGYPFTISFSVENTELLNEANNLVLSQTLPESALNLSAGGDDWVDASGSTSVALRRGGLDASQSSSISVTLTLESAQTFDSEYTIAADEFAQASANLQIEVIESYLSWSSGLVDSSFDGDEDSDGVSALLEYAFGGDPATASLLLDGGTEPLLPRVELSIDGSSIDIIYIRRTDSVERALTYTLESRSDLASESWGDASSEITETHSEPIQPGFERVVVTLPATEFPRFYRLAIGLSE